MKLKSDWVFNYKKGIREAMVSWNYYVQGEKLYFAGENNYLYCIDKTTGKELMTKKKTKRVCRDIYVEDKGLIVISDKGQVEHFQLS